jgi:Tudor domain
VLDGTSLERSNAQNTRWLSVPTSTGPSVMSFYPEDNDGNGKWYRSSIMGTKDGKFLVAFDDFGGVDTLPPSCVCPIVPIKECIVVRAYLEESIEWFDGTVIAAHPSRRVAIGNVVPSW